MYNFFKVFSIICVLLFSIIMSIIFESLLYGLLDLIFNNNTLIIIVFIILGIPLLVATLMFFFYFISNIGWLIIFKNKIVYFGKWFKLLVLRNDEIDRVYIKNTVVNRGNRGSYNKMNIHIYTLNRPQLDLLLNSQFSPIYFAKKFKRHSYKVNDNFM